MPFKNAISWFEIPATDLNRAQKFYETIFGISMTPEDLPNFKMRMFPIEDKMGVGGAIVDSGGFHKPSATEGPLIYLNANPDVQNVLDKVEAAGGKIMVPKTEISPDYGYMAVIIDTEGNRIGFHSIPQQ
jgi:predicted enzyme related to lactoylglutathione lyase